MLLVSDVQREMRESVTVLEKIIRKIKGCMLSMYEGTVQTVESLA